MSNKTRKPGLKLVKNEPVKEKKEKACPKLKEIRPRSYWNTCGKHQDRFPCQVCKNEEKIGDGWSINSPEHNNCFWDWVRSRTFPDGFMNPLSQAETAKMMGCSPTSIHMIEKSAIEKIRNGPYAEIFKDYLIEEPGETNPSEYLVSIPIDRYDNDDDYGDEE